MDYPTFVKYSPLIIRDDQIARESNQVIRLIITDEGVEIVPWIQCNIMIRPAQRFRVLIVCPDICNVPQKIRAITGVLYRVLPRPDEAIKHYIDVPLSGSGVVDYTTLPYGGDLIEAPLTFPRGDDPCWSEDEVLLRLEFLVTDNTGATYTFSVFDWRCVVSDLIQRPQSIQPADSDDVDVDKVRSLMPPYMREAIGL